ncbi:MAG: protein kinase [Planctomycetota bacterium]
MSADWNFSGEGVPAGPPAGHTPPSGSRLGDSSRLADSSRILQRLQPGQRLGELTIQGPLGSGGMATVFRALDRSGRAVAVKMLTRPEERGVLRLEREGQLAGSLRHPGIVSVLRRGEEEGVPYLVYELVEEAGDFLAALTRGPLEGRLDLVERVADAVAHAHRQGIVHRDLKPENVLLDRHGHPRITDFGLATSSSVERLTQTGAMVGTPQWMAPEQVVGERDKQGPPSDVWALGGMLYRALSGGVPPFEGEALHELAAAIMLAQPPAPSSLAAGVSPAVEAVCMRALAKAPHDRYPDGQAFLLALRAARAAPPLAGKLHGARWALAALALAAAAAGGALLELRRRAPAGSAPASSASGATPAPAAAGATPAPSVKPDPRLARGKALIEERRYDEAAPLVQELLAAHPADADCWRLAGDLHDARHRYAGAEEAYGRAAALAPRRADLVVDLANTRFKLGDADGARRRLREAARLDPREVRVALLEGLLCYRDGDVPGTLTAAARLIEDRENRHNGFNLRGLALLTRGDTQGALQDFERSLAAKRTAAGLCNRGLARLQLQEWARAREDLEASIAMDGTDASPHDALCYARFRLEDFEGALRAAERALELDPTLFTAQLSRAGCLERLRRLPEARAAAQRALELARSDRHRAEAEGLLERLRGAGE